MLIVCMESLIKRESLIELIFKQVHALKGAWGKWGLWDA